MKILYYLREFPKLSETFILNEIYTLKQRGHDVAVFAIGGGDKSITHDEFDELDVPLQYADIPIPAGAAKSFISTLMTHSCFDILSKDVPLKINVGNVIWAGQCIEFLNGLEWEIDCIHSHFATPFPLPCTYLSTYYDVPFTLTTHAHDIFKRPLGNYTDKLLANADRVVTISEYNREYMQKCFNFDTPVDVVHAGVRPDKFNTTASPKDGRVLTVSRLHQKKGIMTALEAIATVAQEVPNVEYHIVGSGSQHEELLDRVSSLGIEEYVTFLNSVSDEELLTEFESARCFLLPCIVTESGERDGIPVSLMEAMSMRTPAVSTTVSGIPELIDHGENGLLTAPRDSDATAESVIRLLQNDADWHKFSRRAREKIITEFSVQNQVDGLLTTFKTAQTGSLTDETKSSVDRSAHPE